MTAGPRIRGVARDVRVVLLVGMLAVAAWLVTSTVRDARTGRALAVRESDLERRRTAVLAGSPAPHAEMTRRLHAVLAEAKIAADALEARWVGRPRGASHPSDGDASVRERAEAFFDLAWYTEEMRATAAAADVELMPREAFGFAVHAEGAPRNEDVARVNRQRERIERLLRLLFSAGPARLDAVRRERPPEDRSTGGERSEDPGAERDYFQPEPRLLVRKDGALETLAFQLRFVATGAGTLRKLLNGLLADETAWMVRWVEVAPIDDPNPVGRAVLSARPLRIALLIESIEGRRPSVSAEESS